MTAPLKNLFVAAMILGPLTLTAIVTRDEAATPLSLGPLQGRAKVEGDQFPRRITDAFGIRTEVEKPPAKIASLALASDEVLLDLVPRERLFGVTYLAAAPHVSNVADKAGPIAQLDGIDAEPLLRLQPDLLIVARFTETQLVEMVRQCGIPVFRLGRYDNLDDIRHNIRLLGAATGCDPRAEEIVAWMDRCLNGVRERIEPAEHTPRVLYLSGMFTAGGGSLVHDLIVTAGAKNVAAELGIEGIGSISTEMLLAVDPDALLLSQPFSEDGDAPDQRVALLQDAALRNLTAARADRLHTIPSQHLSSISHYVVLAAVDIARALHPELMRDWTPPPLPPLES